MPLSQRVPTMYVSTQLSHLRACVRQNCRRQDRLDIFYPQKSLCLRCQELGVLQTKSLLPRPQFETQISPRQTEVNCRQTIKLHGPNEGVSIFVQSRLAVEITEPRIGKRIDTSRNFERDFCCCFAPFTPALRFFFIFFMPTVKLVGFV